MEQRTLYEIIGGGIGVLAVAGLTWLTTSAIVKNNYNDRLNKANTQIESKDDEINKLISKQASLRKDFDTAKKAWIEEEKNYQKRIAELDKQVKQGVSLEELRIACIEGEITKDIYKKLKRYTLK